MGGLVLVVCRYFVQFINYFNHGMHLNVLISSPTIKYDVTLVHKWVKYGVITEIRNFTVHLKLS